VHAAPLLQEWSLAQALGAAQAAEGSGSSGSPSATTTTTTLEDYAESDYRLAWHWDNIPLQNAATLAALPPSVHVLDVYHATALRVDSHPQFKYGNRQRQDCLHYCLPGPIDAWVELFAASVRYGEEGGAEFFTEEALERLCGGAGGAQVRRSTSRHVLSGFAEGGKACEAPQREKKND
jgi:hypothetical protein